MIIIPAALPVTCPVCGATFPPRALLKREICPACRAGLRTRMRYRLTVGVIALVISVLLTYAFGIRNEWLVLAAYIALLPATFAVMFVTVRLFAIELEPTGDFTEILYEAQEPAPSDDKPEPVVPSPDIRFEALRERRTVEGIGIAALAILVLVGFAYSEIAPLVARVFPEFGATRSGPYGFPIRVHIGRGSVAFTNGSTHRWSCVAALIRNGMSAYTAVFIVEAAQTHPVIYADFLQANERNIADVESAARYGGIELRCYEPSGVEHFATLTGPGQ